VKVEILPDKEFDARFEADSTLDTTRLAGKVTTLKALGQLPPNVDLAKEEHDEEQGVLGFYDPRTKQIAVRGYDATPFARYVLVHELTHALQDQYFDLSRLPTSNDDVGLAVSTIYEGDAERTMSNYLSTLTPLEQDAIQREANKRDIDLYSQQFYLSVGQFPYVIGPEFVNALLANGGQGALDAASRQPPMSTAEILQPVRYLVGPKPVAVAPPPADGTVVDQGVLGEFELVFVLADAVDPGLAIAAAREWNGNHYVSWQSGGRSCIRARFATLDGGAALAEGLQAWARLQPSASVTGTNPVTVTSCA
jgi:hypothetical protein